MHRVTSDAVVWFPTLSLFSDHQKAGTLLAIGRDMQNFPTMVALTTRKQVVRAVFGRTNVRGEIRVRAYIGNVSCAGTYYTDRRRDHPRKCAGFLGFPAPAPARIPSIRVL
jgi:hypothetical protein